MREKLIAGLLAALAALPTIFPLVEATALNTFPTFLGLDGSLDAYVVVGSTAATSDVVGAIDVAVRLAELSYTSTAVGGVTATVTGKEDNVNLQTQAINAVFGSELTASDVPALFRGVLEQNGTKYTVVEKVQLPAAYVKTDASTLNGTLFLDFSTETPVYNYTIENGLGAGNFSETKPLKVKLFGQEFLIKSITPDSFTAFTGVSGSASAAPKVPVVYGDYKIYTDTGISDSWAHVYVMKGESQVGEAYITKGSKETVGDIDIKLTSVYALPDGTVLRADLIVGPKDETEKTYSNGDYFPGTDLWKFTITTSNSGQVLNAIALTYEGTNETYYYVRKGDKLFVPNNYLDIGFKDLKVTSFATVTVKTGKASLYSSATATSPIAGYNYRPAIILEADQPIFNNKKSYAAYLVMNNTLNEVALGYLDPAEKKVVLNTVDANLTDGRGIDAGFSAVFYQHTANVKLVSGDEDHPVNSTTLIIEDGGGYNITANYTLATTGNEFTLGARYSAEDSDVDVDWDDSVTGTFEYDATSPYGTVVKSIKENAKSDKVVVALPEMRQQAIIYVGKLGAGVAAGEVRAIKPITTPVALLDTEVTPVHKTKNLVLVGGPCVNTLVADLKTAGKFPYGCADWPARNFGLIKVIDDAFATGKKVVVVAGTRAEDTRLACSVLQNYETKLATVTSDTAEVTGVTGSEVVTPA